MNTKAKKHLCEKGHTFYKSSDCPVCPKCWAGYYRKRYESDFPFIGAPALRALIEKKIYSLHDLAEYTEQEIADLHGVGKEAIKRLREAMGKKNLSFRKS